MTPAARRSPAMQDDAKGRSSRVPYYVHGATAMTRFPRTVLLALLLAVGSVAQAVTVVPLNDTGQTLCYDSAGTVISCASSGTDDGRYGRDAASSAGQLSKIGAGSAGFDFSKIANNGSVLAASAALGSNPSDWACTKDNVTGLIWEVKTTSGLRSNAHTYTWYSLDSTSNGGNPGSLGTNTCGSTLSAYSNQCNTANYIVAVNTAGLCGYSDWRLPGVRELLSLVDNDVNYFPNSQSNSFFWTATNVSDFAAYHAWGAIPADGIVFYLDKTTGRYVRIVRGPQ